MKLLGYDQLLYFFKGLKNLFVAKEDGKGLSTNDYTNDEKTKLAGIEAGANKTIVDSALSDSSTNPVQNKVVKTELDKKAVKTDVDTALAGKADASHTHAQSDITGLSTALAGKANTSHAHAQSDITGLADTLAGKASLSHTHAISDVTNLQSKLDAKVETSKLGQANGVATLDDSGKVPSSQLPSYVDDVLEGYLYGGKFYKESSHNTEMTGENGKIYVDLTTNYSYRWSGSTYVKIESVDITLITNTEIDTIVAS